MYLPEKKELSQMIQDAQTSCICAKKLLGVLMTMTSERMLSYDIITDCLFGLGEYLSFLCENMDKLIMEAQKGEQEFDRIPND